MFLPAQVEQENNQIDKAGDNGHDIDVNRGFKGLSIGSVIISNCGLYQISTETFCVFCESTAPVVEENPETFQDSADEKQPGDPPLKLDEEIWSQTKSFKFICVFKSFQLFLS